MEIDIFTYWWNHQDNQDDMIISCYGLTKDSQSVNVKIHGFTPYIYVELDTNIPWTNNLLQEISRDFKNRCKDIHSIKYVKRKKLFYNHKYLEEGSGEWKDKLYPYLLVNFTKKVSIYNFEKYLRNKYTLKSLNRQTTFKIHENNASPVLQYICNQNLPTANWIRLKGKLVETCDKNTLCDFEYICNYKNIIPIHNKTSVPNATVMSFDLEVNSSNPERMPNSLLAADKIFQISCVIGKTNLSEPLYKYLITLGKTNDELLDKSITVIECENEGDLLLSYTKLIREHNPQILIGYNIFNFDIPYMIERSHQTNVYYDFTIQGYNDEISQEKEIRWSSTAYKNQCFKYLDAHGRLYVDMLPIIQRDYKLNNYKLKTVSDMFIGETKDPLTAKDIFKCYRIGMENIGSDNSRNSLSIVGKYCIQDSVLVYKLFNNLQTWLGLVEMATTCNVPIFVLYTQGQQIKVFSQIYKVCLQKGYVVEKDGYIADENDKLTGAIVLEPIPGVYDKITPFDFTSLYPTTIIAYNLCFSTLVKDTDDIDDELCHVIEYAEHKGCVHDESNTKVKADKIICQEHRYRFLKEPKGIVPILLEDLLEARTQTRKKQSEIKKLIKESLCENDKANLEFEYQVLEKRQLAYKVSANSVYGAYGTRKGYLPFLAGAQCTTALGRKNIIKAATYIQEHYNAKLVYGDTDSVYVNFPGYIDKSCKELWDFCEQVEKEINNLFIKPLHLSFESAIYERFFILTKKRYICLKADRDGNISDKLMIRGVLLTRRDNADIIRQIYKETVMSIFYKKDKNCILSDIIDRINNLFILQYPLSSYIITKSIGDVADYKVRPLSDDMVKRNKRLKELQCDNEDDYKLKSLPANFQLSEKMRRRGKLVSAGQRIEYIVTNMDKHVGKQFEKIEDYEYVMEHRDLVNVDSLYYVKLMSKPLDELLHVGLNIDDFVANQYKWRLNKWKCLNELKYYFKYNFREILVC